MVYGRETLKVSSLQRAVVKSENTKGASSNVEKSAKIWGALSVQMDFTQTFEANAKCNNINHVSSQYYKVLVVLKYHRHP